MIAQHHLWLFSSIPARAWKTMTKKAVSNLCVAKQSVRVRGTNQRRLLSSCRKCYSTSESDAARTSPAIQQQIYVDFKHIRDNVDSVKANASLRGMSMDSEIDDMLDAYRNFCERAAAISDSRAEQKRISKMIPHACESTRPILIAESKALKSMIATLEDEYRFFQQRMWSIARSLPNETHPSSPIGWEENATVVAVKGEISTGKDWNQRDHVQIANELDIVDFEAGASVSGRGFYYLKGDGAMLELALVHYTIHKLRAHGFEPLLTPDLIRETVVLNCGFQPRGNETQVYRLDDHHHNHHDQRGSLCLSGTAEIPIAGMHANKLLRATPPTGQPRRYVAFGHCFRAEAGGAGTESRGLYRVHQFSKVEMFSIVSPPIPPPADTTPSIHDADITVASNEELEALVAFQMEICDELGLRYRVLDMPTEELGAPAYRKYDIEAWMPGRNSFGEICSASNCVDYQSRRFNIKYESGGGDTRQTAYVHTLNATAMAVPRVMIALLENGQQRDGSVVLPECLERFMGGTRQLFPRKCRD
eukprot:m.189758 g.189758  ORF g.189758 m.189758 type:complete len:534 (+) comp18529_c1_seq2:55-1656(+)